MDEQDRIRITHAKKTPPRPDYRWVVGEGRRKHEPELPLFWFPAPPKVPVMVPSDIADDVKAYADRRDAERRPEKGSDESPWT